MNTPDTPTTPAHLHMTTLSRRLAQINDEEQVRLNPLPGHAIAGEEEHLRRHYALLLAALLTMQPQVSDPQSRLFVLLLGSLELGDIRPALLEEARTLQADTLIETARLIREAKRAEELLVDALVLLRLEGPLSEETSQLVSELAAFLTLDADTVQLRANHAGHILGLDEGDNSDVVAKYWPERIPYQLTAQTLVGGLNGGLWYVKENLTIHTPWKAENAVFIFDPGATITTHYQQGTTNLKNCQAFNPVFEFAGIGELVIEESSFQGKYTEKNAFAIKSAGIRNYLRKSKFSTEAATAFIAPNAPIYATETIFEKCGGKNVRAGAIIQTGSANNSKSFENCRFHHCFGEFAGALLLDCLYGVNNCKFSECQSTEGKEKISLAINAKKSQNIDSIIFNSSFINSRVNLGDLGLNSRTFIKESVFDDSDIYYHQKITSAPITSACQLLSSKTIEKAI